ncbi:McrC family protein [Planctomyces sp. SH-PL14]|uniref:McrC family protein n=1 Tax=Planctomyces sp. SH-PL14 TaxID=1632864 RepID=UPI0012E6F11F|nr:hypothetical protein [Planctomyces sp. SH-PL14]
MAARSIAALHVGPMLEVDELREGTRIRSFAFVGRVSFGSVEVTIDPKIPRTPLMALLRYACGGTRMARLMSTPFSTEDDSFQDLLVEQLAREAENLLKSGLIRCYSRQTEWLSSPRGRIDLATYARAAQTSAKLHCTHFPRLADWAPNQLLRAGLKLAASLATSVELRSKMRRLMSMMGDAVTLVPLNRPLMEEWERGRSRQTRAYETAVELIRLLAHGAGLSLSEENETIRINGFLFDMNRFFQTILSRFLQEHLAGYEVEFEHRLKGMMSYVREKNPRNRQSPTPRPDLAILRRGRVVRLLDAKYRDLWNSPLPTHMLYQLAVYAIGGGADGTAAILYPTTDPQARDAAIAIRDPVRDTPMGQVVLRPINLIVLSNLVRGSNSRACQQEAMRWAGVEW